MVCDTQLAPFPATNPVVVPGTMSEADLVPVPGWSHCLLPHHRGYQIARLYHHLETQEQASLNLKHPVVLVLECQTVCKENLLQHGMDSYIMIT